MDKKITNEEEALTAVRQDGYALKYVPEKFKTAELCLEAVKQDGMASQYVPEELRTVELCVKMVKSMIERYVREGQRDEVRRRINSEE